MARRIADAPNAVQQTDSDARQAARSACDRGYVADRFVASFCPSPVRRTVVINRGTYVRIRAIDRLVRDWIDGCIVSDTRLQVVSLGAGTDTRYFRLCDAGLGSRLLYHELDYAAVVRDKIRTIRTAPQLRQVVGANEDADDGGLVSAGYCIHAVDLDTLSERPPASFSHLDPCLPTLFLSEACLVYLRPDRAQAVLDWITRYFAHRAILVYEPIGGHDAFGRTMVHNLAARGICLQTLTAYPTVEAQTERFRHSGFTTGACAQTLAHVYSHCIADDERARLQSLEFLDELEELELLLGHYCIALGWHAPLDDVRAYDQWLAFAGDPPRYRL